MTEEEPACASADVGPLLVRDRSAALQRSGLLDGAPEKEFDRIADLAARLTGAPIALLSIVAADRQVFKSVADREGALGALRETPLSHSFCQHVVARDAPLLVSDAPRHPLVSSNGAVTDLGVMAYLGVPVHDPDGVVLGALCTIEGEPREWTPADVDVLCELASITEGELSRRRDARRFQSLVQSHGAAMFAADATGAAEELGRTWSMFTGQTPEETRGFGWAAAICPEDRARVLDEWAAHARGLSPYVTEFKALGADGSVRRFSAHAIPVNDASGRFLEYIVTLVDVEEARAATDALRQQQALIESVFETAPVMMGMVEVRDGQVRHLLDNAATETFFGVECGALQEQTAEDMGVEASILRHWTEAYQSAISTGQPAHFEYDHPTPDGPRTLSATVAPVDAPPDSGHLCTYVVDDVTEDRAHLQALRTSEARLALALESARMGTWDLDLRTRHSDWSQTMYELFDFEAAAPPQYVWRSRVAPADRGALLRHLSEAITEARHDNGPARFRADFRVCRQGQNHWLRSLGQVHCDASGVPVRVTGTCEDVTDEHEHAEALKEARDAAEEARAAAEASARLQRSILHNMSHEIRTPLTSVIGCSELLATETEGTDQELVTAIQSGGYRLLDTLDSVLTVARLEAEVDLETAPVDLSAEAVSAGRMVAERARRKDLEFVLDVEEASWVQTDQAAAHRVLVNLATNAVKYTDSGQVSICVRSNGGRYVDVVISDTGRGMSRSFLDRAFRPFEQESAGFRRSHEGAGLGLAIVRQLVGLVGASLEVESEVGVGTEFRIRFPAVAPPDGSAGPPGARPAG